MRRPGKSGEFRAGAFVGDRDGRLWRVDVSSQDPEDWEMKIFYDAFEDETDVEKGQPVFLPPVISVDDVGDVTVAFATGNRLPVGLGVDDEIRGRGTYDVKAVGDVIIDRLFEATIEATEEAIINAMVAAPTVTGRDGITAHALPHDRLREVMAAAGRLAGG